MKPAKKLPKVTSLRELFDLADTDDNYRSLLLAASENLGGPSNPANSIAKRVEVAKRWLMMNANETSESGVVAEVNFVRRDR